MVSCCLPQILTCHLNVATESERDWAAFQPMFSNLLLVRFYQPVVRLVVSSGICGLLVL